MHEETFFELAGELADKLLEMLQPHKLNVFYLRHAVEAGVV